MLGSSSSALIIALAAWTFFVFVIPGLGTTITGGCSSKHRRWSNMKYAATIYGYGKCICSEQAKNQEKESNYGATMENINRDNDRLRADFNTQFNAFNRMTKTITNISPAAAFSYFATGIADTGIWEENRLREQVVRHKDGIWQIPRNSKEDIPSFSFPARNGP